jgi:hypothetical protein
VNINFTGSYTLNNKPFTTQESGKLKAIADKPNFSGGTRFVNSGYKVARNSGILTSFKLAATRVGRESADDIARSSGIKKLLRPAIKFVKRSMAFCAATITGAVLAVRNFGDDVKQKVRANVRIRPIKLMKDAIHKAKAHISELDDPLYYSSQRAQGPGVSDVFNKVEAGTSQALGVNIKESGKHIFLNKIRTFFHHN